MKVAWLSFSTLTIWLLTTTVKAAVKAGHKDTTPISQALADSAHTGKSIPTIATKDSPTQLARAQKDDDEKKKSPAAHAVEEALSILQTIQPYQNRVARRERSKGVLGTALYYAKETFVFLFMNGPPQDDHLNPSAPKRKLSKPLAKATKLLEDAAEDRDQDAIFLLAEMSFFGNYSYPKNYKDAFRRYDDLASLHGNSSAQYMLGFMYATGIGGSVERDQAKALMYHTFAALGGDTKSQMTVAYRHHTGVGTPRNCDEAAYWYKEVADKAIAFSRSGPPGGQSLQRDVFRIADENGGVYGEGASVISSGVFANKAGPNSDQHAAFDDVLEYLDLLSLKGDIKATFSLGRLHYEGSRTMKRNLRAARAYFMLVARKYWAKDGSIITDDSTTGKFAAKAAGYLGRMFLRGEGMEQSFDKALTWFRRGLTQSDALCEYELGLMYLEGLGVRRDVMAAADYFKGAASQDFASAHVRLGQLFLDQGDITTATRYLDIAARHGHIEAFYHLAEISNNGIGRERSCGMATAYYKLVAEKVETIHSAFEEANIDYEDGEVENALIAYMMAAEQGYEASQANVAYLLDEHKSILPLDSLLPWKPRRSSLLRNSLLALVYWTRSARQSNIDSMVKMGDYYLGGYGVEADMEKAATCYQTAAETHQSAQALWNLGWIHENGIGVDQDFHLAKRFYDQALETNTEAYLPVKLSLTKLRLRSAWNTLTRGKVNSIQSEPEPEPAADGNKKEEWSFGEWISNFLEEQQQQGSPHPYYGEGDGADDDYIDQQAETMPGGDDFYDIIDDGILESLIIVGLAAALAFLVYYRQQRQAAAAAARRQQQQGQVGVGGNVGLPGQQVDGGFFPQQGDPAFGQWVAGGVGH